MTQLKHLFLLLTLLFALSSLAQTSSKFTAAEQQQVSIETPGLFTRSNAFSINFFDMKDSEYSFPLPVGKATGGKDNTLEIVTTEGDAVKAMFEGSVRLSRRMPDGALTIVIRHRNGLETVYSGNAQNLVKVGDNVKAGQTIAIVGKKSDGTPCLTFSIMVNGARINPAIIVGLSSHKLRLQTLLCEKQGNYISVSGDNTDITDEESDKEEKQNFSGNAPLKLNLSQIKEGTWAYPLPGCKVISPYGGKRRHAGVDLKTKPKDDILAAFDGEVTRSCPYHGYGNVIVIKHANGLETLYSHQYKNLVKTGDRVKAGQVIGLTGRTGRATTEHLHFEARFRGQRFNPDLLFNHAAHSLQKGTLSIGKGNRVVLTK